MNPQDYVPILRWKRAEKSALTKLDPEIRKHVTPLFEFIMPAPKTDKKDYKSILEDSRTVFNNKLLKTMSELNECCTDGSVFIDVHLVEGALRANTLQYILDSAEDSNAILIPVTHIIPEDSTNADSLTRAVAIEYARTSGAGLCIRIDRISLDDKRLASIINHFLDSNELNIENTDILVDLGIVSTNDDPANVAKQLANIPNISNWRNFIVSGGAFPKDLSEFESHSHQTLPRYDWKLWSGLSNSEYLSRVPVYSDYTIQHPIHYEITPGVNVSASVRYTGDDQWNVMRGEGLRNERGAGYRQYIAHASIMITQAFFKGANYSFGDGYIFELAQPNNSNTGNPETWLKAGINHHITLVVKQCANSSSNKVSV